MRELVIDGVTISDSSEPYIIAELGHSHGGSVETCKQMIDAAVWAGCSAVKLQKRDNKTLYSEEFYNAPYNSENAYGATYGLHREALEFDYEQYSDLQGYAAKVGITFFATAFDLPSAEFLHELGIPAFKIASGDLLNYDLIQKISSYKKPVIFSTGGGMIGEANAAHRLLNGCPHAILHCTSGYPANYNELNLKAIETFRNEFPEVTIGWSAHDTGIFASLAAYALGARIIEKHFTLNRAWKGTDQAFSLEPQGMKQMVDNLHLVRLALGDGIKCRYQSEIEPLKKQLKDEHGKITGQVSLS